MPPLQVLKLLSNTTAWIGDDSFIQQESLEIIGARPCTNTVQIPQVKVDGVFIDVEVEDLDVSVLKTQDALEVTSSYYLRIYRDSSFALHLSQYKCIM